MVAERLSDLSCRSRSVGAQRRYARPLGCIGRRGIRCTAIRRDDRHRMRLMAMLPGRQQGHGRCAGWWGTGRGKAAPRLYRQVLPVAEVTIIQVCT